MGWGRGERTGGKVRCIDKRFRMIVYIVHVSQRRGEWWGVGWRVRMIVYIVHVSQRRGEWVGGGGMSG